jgi:hypothetical protein
MLCPLRRRNGVGRVQRFAIVMPNAAHALRGRGKDRRRRKRHQRNEQRVLDHILSTVVNPKRVDTLGHTAASRLTTGAKLGQYTFWCT